MNSIPSTNYAATPLLLASDHDYGLSLDLFAIGKYVDNMLFISFRVISRGDLVYDGPSMETAVKKYAAMYDALTLL